MASNWNSFPAAMLLIGLATTTAFAQGVGINATGAAADTSALLDLSSTKKGFLPPRMTMVQRGTIVLPATGLVVYQSDLASGLYWNAGTPGAPNWKQVSEAGAGGSGPWTVSGANIFYSAGNVGIQRPSPLAPLDVLGGNWDVVNGEGDFRIGDGTTRLKIGIATAGGGTGAATIMEHGPAGAYNVLSLGTQGNKVLHVAGTTQRVGIGTDAPTAPLGFAATTGKKISLYPAGTGDYGFGIAAGRLQIATEVGGTDVAIGYDAAGTFTERFAFKNNGALAVNGNAGSAGQVLQSNGGASPATWVAPSGGPWSLNGSSAYYNAGNVGIGTNAPNAPLGFPPALGKKITLYPGLTGDVGIGVAGNRLQLYADNPNADVALGYDQAGVFNERFAVKPTGALAVNGNVGGAGQVLQSNGGGAAATWVSPTNSAYNNVYQAISTTGVTVTAASPQTLVPGLSQTFSVAGNARVLVSTMVPFQGQCCFDTDFSILIKTDDVVSNLSRVHAEYGPFRTFTAFFMVDVGAGIHTIQIVVTPTNGASVAVGGEVGFGLKGSLTLQVIPQ